jgi:hypothetical protein
MWYQGNQHGLPLERFWFELRSETLSYNNGIISHTNELGRTGLPVLSLLNIRIVHSYELRPKQTTWTDLWAFLEIHIPDAQCQDYRDRIFGLLGLVKKELRIEADYNSSLWQIIEQVLVKELGAFPNPREAVQRC